MMLRKKMLKMKSKLCKAKKKKKKMVKVDMNFLRYTTDGACAGHRWVEIVVLVLVFLFCITLLASLVLWYYSFV